MPLTSRTAPGVITVPRQAQGPKSPRPVGCRRATCRRSTRAWLRISARIRSSRGSVSRSTWVIIAPTDGMDLADLRVHLVRHGAVARVALATRAQLDQLHRLAGVDVEHEPDPVAEAERVRRGGRSGRGRRGARIRAARARARGGTRPRSPRARPARVCPRRGRGSATATGPSASGGAGDRGTRRSRRRSRTGSGALPGRAPGGSAGWRARRRGRRAARRARRRRARRSPPAAAPRRWRRPRTAAPRAGRPRLPRLAAA